MKRIYFTGLLLLTTLFFFQCQREISFNGSSNTENTNPSPINSNIQGNVFDENGSPASGVSVKVGAKIAVTDHRGYFRILNADLDKKASLVTAEKNGYFKAFRTFGATSGTNHIEIKLTRKTLSGTVDAVSGGEVSLSDGSKITLPANGVVKSSGGSAYSGEVQVYAAYIDPTEPDISQTVPGSFMANDKDNNRVQLASYGMMAVELESASGEKLQVKPGAVAKLTMPIPSSILASAPQTIPMWYVDEQTGLWKEEGTATKAGNNYVGDVKHFTYWNCDINLPAVSISFTLKNPDGLPFIHAYVQIVRASNQNTGSAHGVTDSLGQVNGLVPANEPLVLRVLDNCGIQVYAQNIGPFSQATNLGVITLTNLGSSALTINGSIVNCSGAPVSSGHARIYVGNMLRYAETDANGNFSLAFIHCGTTSDVNVIAVDESSNQQGNLTSVNLTTPVTNTGTLSACGTSSAEYIHYTLDGVNYTTDDSLMVYTFQQAPAPNTTHIVGGNNMTNTGLSIYFNHASLTAGTYPVHYVRVNQHITGNTIIAPFNVVVTSFPQTIGQFYEGSFEGQFKDASNVTHTISGTFRKMKD